MEISKVFRALSDIPTSEVDIYTQNVAAKTCPQPGTHLKFNFDAEIHRVSWYNGQVSMVDNRITIAATLTSSLYSILSVWTKDSLSTLPADGKTSGFDLQVPVELLQLYPRVFIKVELIHICLHYEHLWTSKLPPAFVWRFLGCTRQRLVAPGWRSQSYWRGWHCWDTAWGQWQCAMDHNVCKKVWFFCVDCYGYDGMIHLIHLIHRIIHLWFVFFGFNNFGAIYSIVVKAVLIANQET